MNFGNHRYTNEENCMFLIKISVRTNPHPLINRIIRRRAKVGNKCIACGPFKQ